MKQPQIKALYTDEEITKIVNYFPNWARFRRIKHHKDMVRQIVQTNRIDHFFPEGRRHARGYDIDGLRLLADSFDTVMELIEAYPAVYAYIASHKLQPTVFTAKHLEPSPLPQSEIDRILALAATFASRAAFRRKEPQLLYLLIKHGLIKKAFLPESLHRREKSLRVYSVERLKALVAKYPNMREFHKKQRRAYEYINAHRMQAAIYPKGFTIDRIRDDDIIIALRSISRIKTTTAMTAKHPKFVKYLLDKKIDPNTLLGLPYETAFELIESIRLRRRIRRDENNDMVTIAGAS